MYGVKFSLWLTGAVGPQAVDSRHSSTQAIAFAGQLFQANFHGEADLVSLCC